MPKFRKRKHVPNRKKGQRRPQPKKEPFILDHSYDTHESREPTNAENIFEEERRELSHIDDAIEITDEENIDDIEISIEGNIDDIEISDEENIDDSYFDVQETIECTTAANPFKELQYDLSKSVHAPYIMNHSNDTIQIIELYPSIQNLSIKLNITINKDYIAKVYVHKIELSKDHDMWIGLPKLYRTVTDIQLLLSKLTSYSVCAGNHEQDFLDMTPIGSGIESENCQGYREGDFGAVKGPLNYSSTIRNVSCRLLVQGNRCHPCSSLRRVLIGRKYRSEQKQQKNDENQSPQNYLSKNYKHCNMSRGELIGKINQQKDKITSLQNEISRIKRQFQRDVANQGVTLDVNQSIEMKDAMDACNSEMVKAFPDANSYQRLFWTEQFKTINVKSTKGMRWHPMIIRWCLYLRQKSNAAYEALRDSGFITLPSTRTLFDYSHYTKSANGYQPDVLQVLREEAKKKNMYDPDHPWKRFIGVLFDEIRIKSELVYDKNTGELIGYCNLDKVGNQIMDFEKVMKGEQENDIAKYMLVVMVRGISSDLKFPLAGFPTISITADFLYPIVWKAVRILETDCDLKVLFITCDGASSNRKFFKIHGEVNEFIHYTVNPFTTEDRKIYFISDVPHLVKTTRNCFSNSYSHKNTRKMWKDGKDISWLHILRLYEDHCELSMYSPCPKLTRSHVDITTFGCMKVNLAAQVLSSTVANSLELMYGDNVSETVNFIRKINKFFDCLNVRNLYEGRNKRNANLHPYRSENDNRLEWLRNDFLAYFRDWEQSVNNRPGQLTEKQRKGMMLSHQTLTGIKLSVNSITDCVKVLINAGADFVLTHAFNQDPLEQHFGHYRHRAGDNNNPTVYDVRHTMTQLRAVGAQALNPRRGNIRVNNENRDYIIDDSVLPRRR